MTTEPKPGAFGEPLSWNEKLGSICFADGRAAFDIVLSDLPKEEYDRIGNRYIECVNALAGRDPDEARQMLAGFEAQDRGQKAIIDQQARRIADLETAAAGQTRFDAQAETVARLREAESRVATLMEALAEATVGRRGAEGDSSGAGPAG